MMAGITRIHRRTIRGAYYGLEPRVSRRWLGQLGPVLLLRATAPTAGPAFTTTSWACASVLATPPYLLGNRLRLRPNQTVNLAFCPPGPREHQ